MNWGGKWMLIPSFPTGMCCVEGVSCLSSVSSGHVKPGVCILIDPHYLPLSGLKRTRSQCSCFHFFMYKLKTVPSFLSFPNAALLNTPPSTSRNFSAPCSSYLQIRTLDFYKNNAHLSGFAVECLMKSQKKSDVEKLLG